MEDSQYILELRDIRKTFPGVVALDHVDFNLKKGEIHALVGENGAGKSTLIKIITGILQPDHGEIILEGRKVTFQDSLDAQKHGIAAVYQEPALFPSLSVMENIFMGHFKINPKTKSINWKELIREALDILKSLEFDIDPKIPVKSLSIAERQLVEIARVLSLRPKILILDEPTSALTFEETKHLFNIIRKLRDSGTSIIFVSHRLDEVFEISDRITVLRDGKYIGTKNTVETNMDEIIQMMVGRRTPDMYPKKEVKKGEVILEVENLTKDGEFYNVSFELHEGEILGIAGLVGAGRTELAQAIFGIRKIDSGNIFIKGQEVKITNPKDAIKNGIVYVPEDRHQHGLILPMDITCNITLPILRELNSKGLISKDKEEELARRYVELLDIRTAGLWQKVLNLSGGNQQKVVLAKWLATSPKILILDEPTRGIDVGAKISIYMLINSLAEKGYGIIMISSELPEILGMSDNILVMHEGRIVEKIPRSEATQERILSAAVGKVSTKI